MRFVVCSLCAMLFFASSGLAQETADEKKDSKINSGLLSQMRLRSIGPAFMSGRIGDVAIDQNNPNIWYVGVASGNVWKTTNAGTTFRPIFENYGSYSIGCVTIDPNNSDTVWVGTGENNGGRHIGFGDGIYVSRNGGRSFKNTGLKKSEHISKIIVHPNDPNTIFVASQGPLWSGGGERGLFKSTDGGATWKNTLSAGEYTGVTDVVMDQDNPDVLYAATHQRHRTVWAILNCGPESGIHKSTDGGETWTQLRSGLPGGDVGKISLGVSPQKSNVVYATVELPGRTGGIFRSENRGNSWTKMSDYTSGGTGPHYYQEIYCDPHRFDVLYHANPTLGRSVDGGASWASAEGRTKHVDNHSVAFSPTDPNFVLVGCDGGLYKSYDNARTYQFCANLPLTQFYKVDVDYDFPFYNVVGGTQDNNSQYGPSRTRNVQGIRNSDWRITVGGDGHDNAIDPEDPNIMYCESQQGYISRYDRLTGETIGIQPQPGPGEESLRFNWDSPILISPHDHKRIYFGSKFLHRTDDRGDSWRKVSPDLSRNVDRYKLKMMGRVWSMDAGYDLMAMSQYSNITSISESPVVEGLLYVGTDDGLIQVSEDSGENWRKVDQIYGVPEYAFVNDIKADRHDADTVYACLDNHKTGDYKPYLVKSTDRGRTWKLMSSDLPDRHLVWRIEQDHVNPNLFFLGTEFGLFCSLNAGENWIKLNAGAPNIPFRDLAIQRRENDVVGATFGRGFYVLDDYTPLRDLSDKLMESEFHIFPIRRALWYVQADELGGRVGFQGDSHFFCNNPTFGATFTYFNRDSLKTKRQKRKASESKIAKSGGDVPTPTWEDLRAEELELPPTVYFEVSNEAGEMIARFNGSTSKGIHRTSWNLRFSGMFGRGGGPLAPPGTYSIQGFKKVGTEVTKLGESQNVEVVSIVKPALEQQNAEETLAFQKGVAKLMNTVGAVSQSLQTVIEQMEAVHSAIYASPNGTPELAKAAREFELALLAASRKLNGDSIKSAKYEPSVPSINRRIRGAVFGTMGNTYGATKTHREQVDIAKTEFAAVSAEISSLLGDQLKALHQKLDEAQIPWTEGRAIPDHN